MAASAAGATPAGLPASLRPPLDRRRALLLTVGIALAGGAAWGWTSVDMSVTALLDGLGDMRNLLERMLPPHFVDPGRIVGLAIETFFIAYLGTAIAVVLSTPIAFLAARNTTPHPVVQRAARAVIVVCRAIPDVVFALIFVRAVGIGPLPGILAIGLHSIGMIGKLYADSIEQIDERSREAVLATGAASGQAIATAVVPQVLPAFIGTALYRLDINLRISVILGLVGAGGIGFELQNTLRSLIYDRAMGIVVVIMVLVICVEFLSAAVRRSIIEARSASAAVPFDRDRLMPPWTRQRATKAGYLALFAVGLGVTFLTVEVSPFELLTAVPDFWHTALRLFPPDFSTARSGIVEGMTETVAIGFVTTAIGLVLTIPLGFLSARNVAPNRGVYYAARTSLVVLRSIPELILAIIFVAAMGLGPVAGVFALALGTVGFMAKLAADGIEEIDPGPREAVIATGATRLQETATSVIPQALPSLVANALYVLDVNIRTSAILGIVGGGGIGFLLNNSVRTLELQTTCAIIITLFAVVYAIELLASWIRAQLL